MMMEDNYVLTPPDSPVQEENMEVPQEDDIPFKDYWPNSKHRQLPTMPCKPFCCNRNRIHDSTSEEEKIQNIKEFLQLVEEGEENSENDLCDLTVQMFDYPITAGLMHEHFSTLSILIRREISRIQASSGEHMERCQEVVRCFDLIKLYLLRSRLSDPDDILKDIMSFLHACILQSCKPSSTEYNSLTMKNSKEYNSFHMSLNVYWKVLEIMYIMAVKYEGYTYDRIISSCRYREYNYQGDAFVQAVNMVIWELSSLARTSFLKSSLMTSLEISPFPCVCVKQMWCLIAVILEHKASHHTGRFFSMHLSETMTTYLRGEVGESELDSEVYLYPEVDVTKVDNSTFCVWLLTWLGTDINRDSDKTSVILDYTALYDILLMIIKKEISKDEVEERNMRFYLQCCVRLGEGKGTSLNLLLVLWDYFCKKMNSGFQRNVGSIEEFATMPLCAGRMLEQCQRFSCGQYQYKSTDTSFHAFLGLLGNHFKKLKNSGSTKDWKQMKGRVYSKYHQRRMQELTENGLYNLSCLFVCLCLSTDMEDVIEKLFDLYGMLSIRQNTKTRVVWTATFALILLKMQMNMDVERLADRISKVFSAAAVEFKDLSDMKDIEGRKQSWKIIQVYLDNLQQVFESCSKLTTGVNLLINEGFSILMETCKSNELFAVLSTIQTVIPRIRYCCTRGEQTGSESVCIGAVYNAVWSHILPSVKGLFGTSDEMVETLAELGLLAYDSNKGDFIGLVKFVHGSSFDQSVCCQFWSHVLPVDGVVTYLCETLVDCETLFIKTWISCTIVLPQSSQNLLVMNRCMIQLGVVKDMLSRAGNVVDNHTTCLHFIKAICTIYQDTQAFYDKMEQRNKAMAYFSHIHQDVASVISCTKNEKTLHNVYKVVGFILKKCAPMLFVQAKPDCPLPKLITCMIVPDLHKEVSPLLIGVIKDHLHLFVQGLGTLDYIKIPYVKRRLGDIVNLYLTKFWTNDMMKGLTTAHPLVMALEESFSQEPGEEVLKFRQVLMEIMQDKFLNATEFTLPQNHYLALVFLKDVMKRSVNKETVARDCSVVLNGVLTVPVLSNVITSQQCAEQIACQLLEAASNYPYIVTSDTLTDLLKKFLNTHKKTHLQRTIQTLEKVVKFGKDYIRKMLPAIEHIIVEHESLRGSGVDSHIRKLYVSLKEKSQLDLT